MFASGSDQWACWLSAWSVYICSLGVCQPKCTFYQVCTWVTMAVCLSMRPCNKLQPRLCTKTLLQRPPPSPLPTTLSTGEEKWLDGKCQHNLFVFHNMFVSGDLDLYNNTQFRPVPDTNRSPSHLDLLHLCGRSLHQFQRQTFWGWDGF